MAKVMPQILQCGQPVRAGHAQQPLMRFPMTRTGCIHLPPGPGSSGIAPTGRGTAANAFSVASSRRLDECPHGGSNPGPKD
ncbi:Hypothetical protein PROPJV5_1820 [Propionibacterium ruminifibrarum]|uniref:Uncharacterized protein n=1 Tax=Propionibacterium ruminifibrarum TaxID=1962131 RepID=A0A375I1Z6_9ACTN|nr:Hypothetical protein PROPJV5_1820 [Propionibacterium ruminifibrarum]